MTGRVLVLEHQRGGGIDALGDHLVAAGLELVVAALGEGGDIPEPAGFAALVILGGEMDVWQEGIHPWLAREKALIRSWMAGPPRPLLGICLGHQLLADALGGEVARRNRFEVGVQPVRLTDEGSGDSLLGRLGPQIATLQWHGAEVRRVPAGAAVLASNDRCAVQAMRVGPLAWGVQFHPEVGPAEAERWGTNPRYRSLLEALDGPGGAAGYPARLAAARDAMDATTATMAAALTDAVRRRRDPDSGPHG